MCASNGPLQNPQSKALLIKNKPTKHHKTKETRNQELFGRAGLVWESLCSEG